VSPCHEANQRAGLLAFALFVLGSWVCGLGFDLKHGEPYVLLGGATLLASLIVLVTWLRRRAEYNTWKRRGAAWAHGREDVIKAAVAEEMRKREHVNTG
jgi:hypothetical protein